MTPTQKPPKVHLSQFMYFVFTEKVKFFIVKPICVFIGIVVAFGKFNIRAD